MLFPIPISRASFVRRYKRFFVDADLAEGGKAVTAHCANTGSMLGLCEPGQTIWLSYSDNPKRKLSYSWEFIQSENGGIIGVNTQRPNQIINDALSSKMLSPFKDFASFSREVFCDHESKIDFLITQNDCQDYYLEVKNVHLMRNNGIAEFPDSVTSRGTKHLLSLSDIVVNKGAKAAVLYLVQRDDCKYFRCASDIDKDYSYALDKALDCGVKVLCYSCKFDIREGEYFSIDLGEEIEFMR